MAKERLSRLMSLKQELFCQENLLRCCTFIEFTSAYLCPDFPPFLFSVRDCFCGDFFIIRKNDKQHA